KALNPLGVSTPIIWKGMFPKRITLPIGFSPFGNKLSITVCPMRQTLAEVLTSFGVNAIPSFSVNLRISRYSGATPDMVVGQLSAPLIAWPLELTAGDSSVIYWAPAFKAVISFAVSVWNLVPAIPTPPLRLLAGCTVIILVPILDN